MSHWTLLSLVFCWQSTQRAGQCFFPLVSLVDRRKKSCVDGVCGDDDVASSVLQSSSYACLRRSQHQSRHFHSHVCTSVSAFSGATSGHDQSLSCFVADLGSVMCFYCDENETNCVVGGHRPLCLPIVYFVHSLRCLHHFLEHLHAFPRDFSAHDHPPFDCLWSLVHHCYPYCVIFVSVDLSLGDGGGATCRDPHHLWSDVLDLFDGRHLSIDCRLCLDYCGPCDYHPDLCISHHGLHAYHHGPYHHGLCDDDGLFLDHRHLVDGHHPSDSHNPAACDHLCIACHNPCAGRKTHACPGRDTSTCLAALTMMPLDGDGRSRVLRAWVQGHDPCQRMRCRGWRRREGNCSGGLLGIDSAWTYLEKWNRMERNGRFYVSSLKCIRPAMHQKDERTHATWEM